MILERFIMKIIAPRRLAYRDTVRVYEAIASAHNRCQQGAWISIHSGVPEHDLRHILGLMESERYIERDPGPFDQGWVHDRMLAWWAPGREWPALKKLHRDHT